MTRIAIVTDQDSRSGIGTYATRLYHLMKRHYPSIQLYFMNYLDVELPEYAMRIPGTITAPSLPLAPLVIRHNRSKARAFLGENFDLVHFCGVDYALTDIPTKTIATVHDHYARPLWSAVRSDLRRFLIELYTFSEFLMSCRYLANADGLVSISECTSKDLALHCGLSSTVIHHWIEHARFQPRDKTLSRAALNLPANRRILLNVSQNSINKRLSTLAKIVNSLDDSFLLVKVGSAMPNLSVPYIHISAADESVYSLLFNAVDIYIHTSLKEGFCIPLIEAMASGLPIVSFDTPIAREVLGEAVIFAQEGKIDWNALLNIVNENKFRDTLVHAGLARALSFDKSDAAKSYQTVYERVLTA